ncbi:cytochrome P450 [bacterium]|nr:cytochrome P450 [bacterium]
MKYNAFCVISDGVNSKLGSLFSPYEYFPFGGGSRSCIGAALSMFEMKIALATILRQVRLSLSPELNIYPVRRGITFVPSGNFQLTVMANLQ